jgi:zinc transporter ZupT
MQGNVAPSFLVLALACSALGLLAGPGLATFSRGRPSMSAALDGLSLGLVPALLAVRLLPHLWGSLGVFSIGLAALGFTVLWLADRHGHHAGERLGGRVVYPALIVHAFTDGATVALAAQAARDDQGLALPLLLALVVHRLPEGLFLATISLPALGPRRTWVRIGVLIGATLAGALAGRAVLRVIPDAALDGVVALGLGAMLRLVLHSHAAPATEPDSRAAQCAGFVVGVTAALTIPSPHSVLALAQPHELPVAGTVLPLFIESAPAFVVAVVLAAALPRYTRFASFVAAAVASLRFFGVPLALARVLPGAGLLASAPPPPRGARDESPVWSAIHQLAPLWLVGLGAAAVLEAALPGDAGTRWPMAIQLAIGALLGVVSEWDPFAITPVGAVLFHKSVPIAPVVAFLVAAAHRDRRRSRLVLAVAVGAAAGLAASALLASSHTPELHPLVAHEHHPIEQLCAICAAVLVLASLLERGPRAWFSRTR